jgi:SWI/SNF-related matrix-associated actin-dependent regulator of chromatin subfamily A3
MIFKLISATRRKDSSVKTVVFSQFTNFLDIIEFHLEQRGFSFVRLDGTMNINQRNVALKIFSESPQHTVMLASLAVCSVGVKSPCTCDLIAVEFGLSKPGYPQ